MRAFVVLIALIAVVSAAPAADDRLPVKYDGAQLWRIPYDLLPERNAVAELQNSFGK